jgi:1-acyl-sn-glycerol-3-phosphate acyltransferase
LFSYRLLQWPLRVATRVFFRRIEIVGPGNLPQDGAVLFCGRLPEPMFGARAGEAPV